MLHTILDLETLRKRKGREERGEEELAALAITLSFHASSWVFSLHHKASTSSFLTLVLRPVLVAQNYLGNFMKIPISESFP